jgi:hypothetical protein
MSDFAVTRLPIAAAPPWWRQRWPWFLMLGPALVVLACAYTGWLAFTREDPLVVGDYYKQGQAINQDLRRDRAASALGLALTLRYDAARGALVGRLTGNAGLAPGKLALHLSHATLPERDIRLVLQQGPDGSFEAPLPMLERSRWIVLLESEARDWRLAGTWRWPAQAEIAVRADAR